MCGIVGYVGQRQAGDILLAGLRRLEYRGYDSAGIARQTADGLQVEREVGKIAALEPVVSETDATCGIGHTRWATHGEPSVVNAHPHTASSGRVVAAHNGIIENYQDLAAELAADGIVLQSDTDTEVLVHHLGKALAGVTSRSAALAALRSVLVRVNGTFGLAILSADLPGTILAARRGSPLVIGYGVGEYVVASDAAAVVEHTNQLVYLEDDELAAVSASGVLIETMAADTVERQTQEVDFSADAVGKAGYEHYLHKEIFEQPEALANALRGRLDVESGTAHLGGLNIDDDRLRQLDQIVLIACGTAYCAASVGAYWLEQLTRISSRAVIASEWRYSNLIITERTLCVVISQSGETADSLAAIKEAKARGAHTLGMVNVVGSSIAREVDGGIYLHAGPEISVASTKAFTNMLSALLLLAVRIGRLTTMSIFDGKVLIEELEGLPEVLREVLNQDNQIKQIAQKYDNVTNALYLGRGLLYPTAMEGNIKLKETSYVHSEACAAGEMKHGLNALIDEKLLTVVLAPANSSLDKTRSNLQEVRARGGMVISVTTEGERSLDALSDDVIEVPAVSELLEPFVVNVALQLFAYHSAVARGTDVDQPRNLAKSVTVE